MPKVLVSFPEKLLAELDREVAARGVSRSALIAIAVRKEITAPDAAYIDELLASARSALADSGAWDAGTLITEERARH